MLRLALALCALPGLVLAQSHPSWWTYASPDATALVGIQWQYMRSSLLAGAVAGELAPGGGLNFPDVPLLSEAQQILLSSPELVAIEYGNFPPERLAREASARGLRGRFHQGFRIWVTQDPDTLSIAQISDSVLLLGLLSDLRDTIDRSLEEKVDRIYSPLLARGAKYADQDLWVVSSQLPDPLASRFVPLAVEADSFEGSVGMYDGMHLVASIETGSVDAAYDLSTSLLTGLRQRPALARGTEITTDLRTVLVRIDIGQQDLAESLRGPDQPEPGPATQPVSEAGNAGVTTVAPAVVAPAAVVPADAPVDGEPRTVRILGLGGGPREIPVAEGEQ